MRSKRTFLELSSIESYEDRVAYCQCGRRVGVPTFGNNRYLNQYLYSNCPEWFAARDAVIIRDNGCDLGHPDYPIPEGEKILVHHLNPLTLDQVLDRDPCVFDLNNLVCCRKATHDFIHYSNSDPHDRIPIERAPNDTAPWRK